MSDNDFAAADRAAKALQYSRDDPSPAGLMDIGTLARCYLALRKAQEWQPICTLPDSNDLVWLGKNRGTDCFEIDGPCDPHELSGGFVKHDGFEFWAPCEPPALKEPKP